MCQRLPEATCRVFLHFSDLLGFSAFLLFNFSGFLHFSGFSTFLVFLHI